MLLLLACVAPDPVADSAAPLPEGVVPWDWSETTGTDGDGTLEISQLGYALQAVVDAVPSFDPLVVMATYEGLYAGGADEVCPALASDNPGRRYWEDDCVSSSGTHFFGWVTWNWFRNILDESGNICSDDAFYFGFVRVTDPRGYVFDGYGTVWYRSCFEPDGTQVVDAYLEGDFRYEAAKGTWLASLQPVSLFWTARDGPSEHSLVLDGALSGRKDELAAVRFESLTLTDGEPAGRVTGWDQTGHPYVVDFDGDGDGCAGEVCVDWSPLVDWVGRPWY